MEGLNNETRHTLNLLLKLIFKQTAIDRIIFKIIEPNNNIFADLGSFEPYIIDIYQEENKIKPYAIIDKNKNLVLKRAEDIPPNIIIINPRIIKNPLILIMPSAITVKAKRGLKKIIKDIYIKMEVDIITIIFGFLEKNIEEYADYIKEIRNANVRIVEI